MTAEDKRWLSIAAWACALFVLTIGAIGTVAVVGDALSDDGGEKAYYCGYADGMKFASDKAGIPLGPNPIRGCDKFAGLR